MKVYVYDNAVLQTALSGYKMLALLKTDRSMNGVYKWQITVRK